MKDQYVPISKIKFWNKFPIQFLQYFHMNQHISFPSKMLFLKNNIMIYMNI
uniref:Uncharacterized protein n=1 Tax=Octopus bimaculoides TaxID=37653 RepID=A0A0L8HZZ3_OCTBM